MTKSLFAWLNSTANQRQTCASHLLVLSPRHAKSTLRNNPSVRQRSATERLITSFTPYQPRTFALRLAASTAKIDAVQSQPVTLHYDLAVASNDDTKTVGGGFDGKGEAMPAEMLPATD